MIITSLKKQAEFNIVNKHGQKKVCPCFVIVSCPSFASKTKFPKGKSTDGKFYFGMKVSKKFAKKAVHRNLAKRRIRAAVMELVKENPQLQGSGIIIIPKKHFNQTSFAKIKVDLKKCLV